MQTMNQSLATLVLPPPDHASRRRLNASSNREELQEMINRGAGVVARCRHGPARWAARRRATTANQVRP